MSTCSFSNSSASDRAKPAVATSSARSIKSSLDTLHRSVRTVHRIQIAARKNRACLRDVFFGLYTLVVLGVVAATLALDLMHAHH